MPRKNKYQHYDLNQAKRQTLNIAQFGGVDFSSQKFNVATNHAIDMNNFIYKDGIVQKRSGYEQIALIEPKEFIARDFDTDEAVENPDVITNPVNFNGIWNFKAEDGQKHIVAHIGYLLYEIKNIDNNKITVEPLSQDQKNAQIISGGQTVTRDLLYKYENYKSSAFVGANRLWFLGGNKFMCIRFKKNGTKSIYSVSNKYSGEETEIAFVPTTSIGITYTNARVNGRQGYDYPNKLNMFRRNRLLSGVGKDETEKTQTQYYEYELDSPLLTPNNNATTDDKIIKNIQLVIDKIGEI